MYCLKEGKKGKYIVYLWKHGSEEGKLGTKYM